MRRIPMVLITSLATATFLVAAPALKDPKQDDAARIVGQWTLESLSMHGGQPQGDRATTVRFSKDGTCGITNGSSESGASFSLLPIASPRRLQWLNGPQKTEWLCLYEIDGNRLKLAFVDGGTEPPAKIEPAKNLTIYYLTRVKP
jgi:uncharacterized protein (TIGR03067 family)